jgi:hypothetical protein
MSYLRIFHGRIVTVVRIGCDEGLQIGATDAETRVSVLADVAACVVNTEYPTVESTEIRYLEVRIALFESRAATDFAL